MFPVIRLREPAAEQSSVHPPYDGQIQDADVFIDMPNLRQYGGYTCGTTCVQMVMNWLDPYQADWNLAAYEEELGTNEEAGTPPGSIVSFFEENSVTVTAKENRTTSELASALYRGTLRCSAFRHGLRQRMATTPKIPMMRTPI